LSASRLGRLGLGLNAERDDGLVGIDVIVAVPETVTVRSTVPGSGSTTARATAT
jgi:hypothetical protein